MNVPVVADLFGAVVTLLALLQTVVKQPSARTALYVGQALLLSIVAAILGYQRGFAVLYLAALGSVILRCVVLGRQLYRRAIATRAVSLAGGWTLLVGLMITAGAEKVSHTFFAGSASMPTPAVLTLLLLGLYATAAPGDRHGQVLGLLMMDSGLFLAAIWFTSNSLAEILLSMLFGGLILLLSSAMTGGPLRSHLVPSDQPTGGEKV